MHLKSLPYKVPGGHDVQRACYGMLAFITDSGAGQGSQAVVYGKLLGQWAKKFGDIHSGDSVNYYIAIACTACCSDRMCWAF